MRKKIFISYSSKDRKYAEEIHRSLDTAGFEVWRDQTRLETDWSMEIACALSDSDILCLLWTEHSAKSKWIKYEWLTARALEKRIIPCLFQKAPNLPEPLKNLHGIHFLSLEEGLKEFIDRVKWEVSYPVKYDYTILPENSYIPYPSNPLFLGRHADLLDLYVKMIGNLNKIGINQVGTIGMGGIGKTQLAVEFAYRFSFAFRAIYWMQAANPNDWASEYISIARDRLELKIKNPDTPQAAKQYIFALQEYFKNHPNTLVIMDNVVDPMLLNNNFYLFGITPMTIGCDLLFTTRRHFQLPGVSSQQVNVLPSDDAYKLLTSYRFPETPEEEGSARSICNAVGYLPMAIVLIGGYLRKYKDNISFDDYYQELVGNKLGTIDFGNMSEEDLATRHAASMKKTLENQWAMLSDKDSRLLFKLAGQFPETAIIPKARLGLLAGIKPGKSRLDQPLLKVFNHLHDLNLVERLDGVAGSVRLHPLVWDFSFHLIPEEERDSFRSAAAQHLKKAYSIYQKFDDEIQSRGVQQVIDDLQVGLDWWGDEGEQKQNLKLLHGALRLSFHILIHDRDQLAGQLIGRLMALESLWMGEFLAQIKKKKKGPWICPYSATMIPPGGSLIRTLTGHSKEVKIVIVTPDGRRVISGSMDQSIKVWDLEEGHEIRTLENKSLFAIFYEIWLQSIALTVTSDGQWAIFGSWYNTLKVWELETDQEIRTLKGHSGSVLAIAATPDMRIAITGSSNNALMIFDLKTGRKVRTLKGHSGPVVAVTVTPDGRKVISGSSDNTLKVWHLETGQEIRTLSGHSGSVDAVAVTPDGRKVISGSSDKTLKVWDLKTGRKVRTLSGHSGSVDAVAVTPDGRKVISGSSDKTLIWDLESGRKIRTLKSHFGPVLALTPDGRRAISRSSIDMIIPDGRPDFSRSYDMTFKVWDIKTGRKIKTLKGHFGLNTTITLTPDGWRAISGFRDRIIKVWDLETGRKIRTLKAFKVWGLEKIIEFINAKPLPNFFSAVSITPDGRWLAGSKSRYKTIMVWDLETGRKIRTLKGHSDLINVIAFTPDGRRVVSGSHDKTLKVWDLQAGQEIMTLEGHSDLINVIALTPDGRRVVSGSEDKSIKLWDLEIGKEIASFSEEGEINSVALGPDGKTLVAGDSAGRVHFLRLEGFGNPMPNGVVH